MTIRIVRFKIADTGNDFTDYETIATSLNKKDFSAEEIKKLYHMRWGIETSFRELKYAVGLTRLHTKKTSAAMQEVLARLIMYNFCECITMSIVIEQKDSRKWTYHVNFTHAIHICKDYFRCRDPSPPDVVALITREILPVRPGRPDKRKTVQAKTFVWFMYRVS